MSRKFKFGLLVLGATSLVVLVALYPYNAGSVPEWKLRIVDQSGRPVFGARVEEEWLDPIREGQVMLESRDTDSDGWVLFPEHPVHNQLANGFLRSGPSAHIFMCWEDQSGQVLYGQLFYDGKSGQMVHRLVTSKGRICPFS